MHILIHFLNKLHSNFMIQTFCSSFIEFRNSKIVFVFEIANTDILYRILNKLPN